MGMLWMGLGMLIFWGALIFLAVLFIGVLFGNRQSRNRTNQDSQDPLEILAQRYARGEITSEQYRMMKEDLEKR
ncbi:MAG: SHOCT domain-containing protein [Omnitrophica WOR_2 bacterium]